MATLLYKITEDAIVPTEGVTEEDVALVEDQDEKALYVYRGGDSERKDEFESKKLYELIVNRFLNSNIMLLSSKHMEETDSADLKMIKAFLLDHMPDDKTYKRNKVLRRIFLLEGIRKNIEAFKTYEQGRVWRKSLSNLTNLRRLSIFNVVALLSTVIILSLKIALDIGAGNFIFIQEGNILDTQLWNLWILDMKFTLGLCIGILAVVLIVNLLFVVFPMKFPINPLALQKIKMPETKAKTQAQSEVKAPKKPPTKKLEPKKAVDFGTIQIDLQKKGTIKNTPKEYEEMEKMDEFEYQSEEDKALGIPAAPLPKAKKKKKLAAPELSTKVFRDKKFDAKTTEMVIVNCERCEDVISIPVPKKMILDSKLPVVEISFIHGKPEHAVAVQLDHDFDIRRQRYSDVIHEKSDSGNE